MRCREWDPRCNKTDFDYVFHEMHYCCCKELLRVKPKAGTAVLFFPALPNGLKDSMSVHAACPVTKGEKFVVQQWYHTKPLPKVNIASPCCVVPLSRKATNFYSIFCHLHTKIFYRFFWRSRAQTRISRRSMPFLDFGRRRRLRRSKRRRRRRRRRKGYEVQFNGLKHLRRFVLGWFRIWA